MLTRLESFVSFDVSTTLKATIDKDTGFLTAPVKLARTGIQYYMGYELGIDDRAMEKIGVFRSPEEVFKAGSIDSFVNLVVTNDHPSELINTGNVKKLQMGSVSHVVKEDSTLSGLITITDKNQISKIKDGKVQVSVGYSNDLKDEIGEFNGDKYEFIQTNIKANHLAIVDAGRCGSACKLTMDKNKKEKAVKITIDGITFNVESEPLAQAIEKMTASHDAEVAGLKEKLKKEEDEKKEEMKKKEAAEAKADATEKAKLSDADISKMISDRAVLLTEARIVLGDKMPKCVDCPVEIKTLVIDHILPDMDLKDKSNDYIDAVYDVAIEKAKKTKGSLDSLSGDFKKKEVDATKDTNDREASREKYMKDQLGLEVVED